MKLQDLSEAIPLETRKTMTRRFNVACWHGEQGVKAYRRGDMDTFVRHMLIADHLWKDWK